MLESMKDKQLTDNVQFSWGSLGYEAVTNPVIAGPAQTL